MDLAFVITAHHPGECPETTIIYSPDVAVMSLAAHLRRSMHRDTSYADAVKEAERCIEKVTENLGMSVDMQLDGFRASITRSLLNEAN